MSTPVEGGDHGASAATLPPPSARKRAFDLETDAVRIELDTYPTPEPAPTRRYWCGCLVSSPFFNITKGGVDFQRYSGAFQTDEDGAIQGHPQRGKVVELTESQVDLAKVRIAAVVVRKRGKRGVRFVHRDSKMYSPDPTDVPLGAFLYMVPVRERMPTEWRRTASPPTMVKPRETAGDA